MNKLKSNLSEIKHLFVSHMKKGECFCAIIISVLITFFLEIMGRRDILGGIGFLWESPLLFLYNTLIVLITLCGALFLKKRFFGFVLITTAWVALGITNFVLQTLRIMPLTSIDFANCSVDLLVTYIGFIGIILLVIGAVAMLFVFGFVYKKFPIQHKIGAIKTVSMIVVISVSMLALSTVGKSFEAEDEEPVNLNEVYEEYGFAYSFARTFMEKGIEEPENYNDVTISRALRNINSDAVCPENVPNIIMIQLESFFDVNRIKDISFSSEPTPVFNYLKETSVSGFLFVPYVGAGTVNSEFEILSGMNIDFFGFGEYPYKSVLQEKSCETVASVIRSLGHNTTALHNYEGTFYDRYIVYENLGFDRFIPVEFMCNTEENKTGWAKDKVLLPYIRKTLESSAEKDFIFGVTVQSHGNYPADLESSYDIKVIGELDDAVRSEYEYYVNEINEVDMFIGALVSFLESFSEPTVLVLYGDHLPCLTDLEDDDLSSGDLFTSEYVIWSNYGIGGEDRDLEAYQLSAYLLDILGVDMGTMFRYHNRCSDKNSYLTLLEHLEYDILYGENYADVHSEKKDIIFGLDDITVDDVTVIGDSVYITGNGFTENSVVFIDGDQKFTSYVSENVLMVMSLDYEPNMNIEIKQVAADGYIYN